MSKVLTIRLPTKLHHELEKFSSEKQCPLSDIVCEALHRYLAVEKFRSLRQKALPFAKARGYLADDDLLKAR